MNKCQEFKTIKKHNTFFKNMIVGIIVSVIVSIITIVAFILLALYVSSIAAAAFASFPLSLTAFAISLALDKKMSTKDISNKFKYTLKSTSLLYILLIIFSVTWYLTMIHTFKLDDHVNDVKRIVWKSWGVGMGVWIVFAALIVILYYTVDSVREFFSGPSEKVADEQFLPAPIAATENDVPDLDRDHTH
jgi:hypothetical protein